MKYPPAMTDFRPSNDAPLLDAAGRCNTIRDGMLVGLLLFTLVRSSEALAADQATFVAAAPDSGARALGQPPESGWAMAAVPPNFAAPAAGDMQRFSATDFRPRRRTLFDGEPAAGAFDDAPLIHSTTVWQRLSEYKSHDRVQLLTLWESSGSTVSIQAGRRGDPSLQWTSRLMNRGGATQGLLDRLFSVSLARASSGLRNVSRSASSSKAAKPAGAPAISGLK